MLNLILKARDLRTTWAELQVVHVPPSGLINFPNRSGFEVTHTPGSADVLASTRALSINLVALHQRFGTQVGHLYAVTIHSQPKPLEFRQMSLEVRAPGLEATWPDLDLADHAALLGVWWQRRDGGWGFEYSGKVLDTMNATYQSIFLAGRYAERFADQ
ncbi:hypothetical protein E7T09_20530 [Deinococcus sp. KSM4-11]|uniref:hypothetical protein n=1 Tax=Deinococcus sp. KSM4-11 TaxID=2568654 RepID=UPI0010A3345C|nr:hypothetical protein [Deinococcus sp. KSM4-11]THF84391.1 hypothetical protein E7T09_20530 [Deinococcus sp. KSM4-11]